MRAGVETTLVSPGVRLLVFSHPSGTSSNRPCLPAACHVPHPFCLHTPTPVVVHTPHLLLPWRDRAAPPLFASPSSESRTHTPYSGSYAGMRRVALRPTMNQLCHSATYLLFLGRWRDGHLMRGSVFAACLASRLLRRPALGASHARRGPSARGWLAPRLAVPA